MASGPSHHNDNVRLTYVPAPAHLSAFPDAHRARAKTPKPGGGLRQRWKTRSGTIYEWNYLHSRVEAYDRHGRHLGEFDPRTGARTKPANPDYRIEP